MPSDFDRTRLRGGLESSVDRHIDAKGNTILTPRSTFQVFRKRPPQPGAIFQGTPTTVTVTEVVTVTVADATVTVTVTSEVIVTEFVTVTEVVTEFVTVVETVTVTVTVTPDPPP